MVLRTVPGCDGPGFPRIDTALVDAIAPEDRRTAVNLTIGRTFPRIRRHIPWQPATLVTGLTLAVAAALGLGAMERSSAPTTAPAPLPAAGLADNAVMPTTPSLSPLPIIYVVGTQEQSGRLQEQSSADEMAAYMEGRAWLQPPSGFMVVDSPESERLLSLMLHEQNAYPYPTVSFVDLR
jgi:hypothetical protein